MYETGNRSGNNGQQRVFNIDVTHVFGGNYTNILKTITPALLFIWKHDKNPLAGHTLASATAAVPSQVDSLLYRCSTLLLGNTYSFKFYRIFVVFCFLFFPVALIGLFFFYVMHETPPSFVGRRNDGSFGSRRDRTNIHHHHYQPVLCGAHIRARYPTENTITLSQHRS